MNEKEKRLKNGTYSMLLAILVILGVFFVNKIAGELPDTLMEQDFSSAKLYTLTEETKTFLDTLSQPVDVFYICETGKEDDNIQKLLARYQAAGKTLHVKQVDPALYPSFVSGYTDETVGNNSVLVVNGSRVAVVSYENMYITSMSYETGSVVQTGFDGEGLITSAIDNVTAGSMPVLYRLIGNGELDLPESFTHMIEKNNVELLDLSLLSNQDIPEDATAILIAAPTQDYTKDEADKVIAYLEKGGKALIYTNYVVSDGAYLETPNLQRVLENYGLHTGDGMVLEGDPSYYIDNKQFNLVPTVDYTQPTAKVYEKTVLLAPMSQPIEILDTYRSSISIVPMLHTTDKAYVKLDVTGAQTLEKEEGDAEGQYNLGVLVQEDINQDKQVDTEVIYFSSGFLLSDEMNELVSGANARLFGDTLAYLCSKGGLTSAVPAKNLQVTPLAISAGAANLWTVICVFVLPGVILVYGLVTWLKRRRR